MHGNGVWQRWLWIVCLGLVGFGLGMAFLNRTPAFGVFNRAVDPIFWPGGSPPGTSAFQGWVYGAWGATVAGWGITAACVVRHALRRREAWGWWALVGGVGLWYVIDTAGSALARVWLNVGLNTFLLVALAVPLAAGARYWLKGGDAAA